MSEEDTKWIVFPKVIPGYASAGVSTSKSFRKFHVLSTERRDLYAIPYALRFLALLEMTALFLYLYDAVLAINTVHKPYFEESRLALTIFYSLR